MTKKTVVLGASPNPDRYAYMAIEQLRARGHEVIAIGKQSGRVADVEIIKEAISAKDVHTITLYMRADFQRQYYDYIVQLRPQRIIFNPGTYNPELETIATRNNIEVVGGCTLVMLSTDLY